LFAPTGYGLAFGYDSSDFIPFSQAIIDLKEDAEVARFEEQQKYNIGTKAEIFLQETCNVSDDSEEFTLLEFGGLFVMVGFTISVGLLVQISDITERCCSHNKVIPKVQYQKESF